MKKFILTLSIFMLILTTTLVKNSTKKIEDEIFLKNESLTSLNKVLGDVLLEYNYLSSGEKLHNYKFLYFTNELVPKDVMKFKIIYQDNGQLLIKDFTNSKDK